MKMKMTFEVIHDGVTDEMEVWASNGTMYFSVRGKVQFQAESKTFGEALRWLAIKEELELEDSPKEKV